MTTVNGFESEFRDDLMEGLESEAERMRDDLAENAEANFRAYASRNGYDIEHIWQDTELGRVQRRGNNSVRTSVRWPALTALFEYGVEPHTIRGNPLAFAWDAPPGGTRPPGAPSFVVTDEVNWGSVTGGIDESRAIRNALDGLRFGGGD